MTNKTYDLLNITAKVILPAIITFVGVLLSTVNFQYAEILLAGLTLIETALGGTLQYYSKRYFNDKTVVEDKTIQDYVPEEEIK